MVIGPGALEGVALKMVNVTENFWSGRRVLLTGHTGFKGAWLALWLQQLGAAVTGLALAPTGHGTLFERAHVANGMTSLIGDICDRETVAAAVRKANPEVVFHLAAQPLVGIAFDDPIDTYATNVMGTAHVLEALRACQYLKAVTVITTDKCYDNREWFWPYRETDALGGKEPYGNSKACAELVADCWRQSYFAPSGVSVATARAGNVIGGGDWAEYRIVPDCIRAFAASRPVVLRRPEATRPWQHVLEPLAGYLALAQQQCEQGAAFAEGWNFGPYHDGQLSVEQVVQMLVEGWGGGASYRIERDSARFPEARLLALDISKSLARLPWQPCLNAQQALAWTVDWYRVATDAGHDMRAHTLGQIDAYMALQKDAAPPEKRLS